MAKIKLSAMFAAISGKLNGSVFAKNKGGAYIRTKVTPNNPRTSFQLAVRARLTALSQAWRTLTQTQITAWNGAVNDWMTTNVFGDALKPSGINLYVRLNANILNAGGTALTAPPMPGAVPNEVLSNFYYQTGSSEFAFELSVSPIPANYAYVVEATPSLSPGISNANTLFRQIAVMPAGALSNDNLNTEYVAKFGVGVTDAKVFVRGYLVNLLTGQKGAVTSGSAIVANI